MSPIYFVGVDVGTSSARAALINNYGEIIQMKTKEIKTWNPIAGHFEQSSNNIWEAVCECVKAVVKNISPNYVHGISFDGTCSLVILGAQGQPLTVSTTKNNEQNIILWMDHRADKEANVINKTKHDLLKFVGGCVSLEMQIPKLLWLKNNLYKNCWTQIWRTFDLPDFLTWKCTNIDSRSLCSVVCKWNYDGINNCWSKDFLIQLGLNELCLNNFEIIGNKIFEPGQPIGNGLTNDAAKELGLLPGTPVGTSLIDAHAGTLSLLGCSAGENYCITEKLAVICGTSTCHMSLTLEPCWTKGIWGPYSGAVIPNFYLNEGGQSATGILIDNLIFNHPCYKELSKLLGPNQSIYEYLNEKLEKLCKDKSLKNVAYLTKDLHVWPDFHGNRSPLGDASLKGMISGLIMENDEENLAILYLAFIQALAYGTRHIISQLVSHGRKNFKSLIFSGGLSKNLLYVQMHSNICNIPTIIPKGQEMVLVGAAILAACAAKTYPTLEVASKNMGGKGSIIYPEKDTIEFHNKKYKVFLKMLEDQYEYRNIMS